MGTISNGNFSHRAPESADGQTVGPDVETYEFTSKPTIARIVNPAEFVHSLDSNEESVPIILNSV